VHILTRFLKPLFGFYQAPQSFVWLADDFDIHMGTNATRLDLQRGASPAEYASLPFASSRQKLRATVQRVCARRRRLLMRRAAPLPLPTQHRRVVAGGRGGVREAAGAVPPVRQLKESKFIDVESSVISYPP